MQNESQIMSDAAAYLQRGALTSRAPAAQMCEYGRHEYERRLTLGQMLPGRDGADDEIGPRVMLLPEISVERDYDESRQRQEQYEPVMGLS